MAYQAKEQIILKAILLPLKITCFSFIKKKQNFLKSTHDLDYRLQPIKLNQTKKLLNQLSYLQFNNHR